MFVTATAGLNIRSEPSTGSNVVKALRYGEFVQVDGRSGEPVTIGGITDYWYNMAQPGVRDGFWVFGGYLSEELPEDLPVVIGRWISMAVIESNNPNLVGWSIEFESAGHFRYGVEGTDMGVSGSWSMDGDRILVEDDTGGLGEVENEDGIWTSLPPELQTAYFELKTIDRNNIELSSGHPWFADRSPMRITRSKY
jgi:hypothetical protein